VRKIDEQANYSPNVFDIWCRCHFGAGALRAETALPDKILRILVGFPAGGGTDVMARLIAEPLKDIVYVRHQANGVGSRCANRHRLRVSIPERYGLVCFLRTGQDPS
jgi:hypothetical protein